VDRVGDYVATVAFIASAGPAVICGRSHPTKVDATHDEAATRRSRPKTATAREPPDLAEQEARRRRGAQHLARDGVLHGCGDDREDAPHAETHEDERDAELGSDVFGAIHDRSSIPTRSREVPRTGSRRQRLVRPMLLPATVEAARMPSVIGTSIMPDPVDDAPCAVWR
jgi:hypothetical protein